MLYSSWCVPVGLFWYGWTAQTHQHWILPIIGTIFVGIGLLGTFMPIQTYLVDAVSTHMLFLEKDYSLFFPLSICQNLLIMAPGLSALLIYLLKLPTVHDICCICHRGKHNP